MALGGSVEYSGSDTLMLGDLERGFERLVDSAIARGFRLQVQPAEIGRQLERALLDGAATSVGGAIAPNAFAVYLHPDDAAEFEGWSGALCDEMERWLAELAFRRGLVTIAPIQVIIEVDSRVRRRSVRASAQFQEGVRASLSHNESALVVAVELTPISGNIRATLRAVPPVTIGRAAGNDFVIADERVSRLHAKIELEHGEWCICDLGSTNGTRVNGLQIVRARLADGDEIDVGGQRFRVRLG